MNLGPWVTDVDALPQLSLTPARQFECEPWLRTRLEDISVQEIDAVKGPPALTVMGIAPDLVFTKEAWPHTDSKWAGSVFVTITAIGDMFEFGALSHPAGKRVPPGKVFGIDPLELHWLRPDPMVSSYWLALQWDVPREQAGTFVVELGKALELWNAPGFALPVLGNR